MKLIQYIWGSNSDDMLRRSLVSLGYEVVLFARKCEHYTKDIKYAQELINYVHYVDAQGVISFDYFPIISMVCNTVGIPYYSWIYDSPHYTVYAKTVEYECNHIGCFDRELTQRLDEMGIYTVKHIPLGVDWWSRDVDAYSKTYTDISPGRVKDISSVNSSTMESNRYSCDISFVGSLYTGAYDYYGKINDDWLKKRADELIEKQCFEYEHDYTGEFFRCSSEASLRSCVRVVLSREKLLPGDEYIEDIEYIFEAYFLDKKVTIEERKRLLNRVAELGYDFRLYTGSDLKDAPFLKQACRGCVDYNNEMPHVFKNSRINLNVTLRSIKTGIPLRVLDIMGCGGFLLTDYRKEIAESFKDGRELVIYQGIDDCIDKIKYYLTHDYERRKIALAGREAVRMRFDCKEQLKRLLEII